MKSIIIAVLFFGLTVSICKATQVEVSTMDELVKKFEKASNKTLAIFDIDMVLIQPQEAAFQMANMKRYRHIVKETFQDLPKEKVDICMILMTIGSTPTLIDSRFPEFLNTLHRTGVPVMALTANFTGRFGSIESMETWKVDRLKNLGIDFAKMAPYSKELTLDTLPSWRGSYCRYTDGICFVNGSHISKGEALVHFLVKTGLHPEEVIFVDDREENLQKVQEALTRFFPAMLYTGIHFTAAQNIPSEAISEEEFKQKWRYLAKQALQWNLSTS